MHKINANMYLQQYYYEKQTVIILLKVKDKKRGSDKQATLYLK